MNLQIRNLSLALALVFAAGAVQAQDVNDGASAPLAVPVTADTPHDPSAPNPAPVHPELAGVFADFGGMPGMTALMEDFMAIMLADPRLRRFFENTDQVRVKRQLAEQFCAILGGGCAYSGRDMKTTHAAFAIDRANFNALVEDLQVAMNRKRIPFRSQNKLLAVLAPMHREAVTR
jgi:hemoglobin